MQNRNVPTVELAQYAYELPDDRIAERPKVERDASKLLVYRAGGSIDHKIFNELPNELPHGSLLVANRSRVVSARILASKPTGGKAEVLLTEPVWPSEDPAVVLASSERCRWRCLLGGRNILPSMALTVDGCDLSLTVIERSSSEGLVELSWEGATSLAEMLNLVGHVPLPPYIKRDDDDQDKDDYQTIFAREDGSVAAPTAGLHFTHQTMDDLEARSIAETEVTLHVGLGTFQPVTAENIKDHDMHQERIEISLSAIDDLIEQCLTEDPWITAVGTTSIRTLESVYWYGAGILNGTSTGEQLWCDQWAAFADGPYPSRLDAFRAVRGHMQTLGVDRLFGYTQLCLAPGAHIGVVDALVTNFHQPGNTLIMLVAAFVGDAWREIYESALANDYRFLSYGDSSLLVR